MRLKGQPITPSPPDETCIALRGRSRRGCVWGKGGGSVSGIKIGSRSVGRVGVCESKFGSSM